MVGDPGGRGFAFYLMFDVDDPQIVVDMIHQAREPIDGIRMDRYVRFEARVGRPFFLLEQAEDISARRSDLASPSP